MRKAVVLLLLASFLSVPSMAQPKLIGNGFEGTLGEAWVYNVQKADGWKIRTSTVSGQYTNFGVTQGLTSLNLVDTGPAWGARVLGIGIWRIFDDLKLANYITMDVTLCNPTGELCIPDNWIEFDIEIDGGVGKHLLPVIALSPIPETPQTYTLSFPIPQAVRDSTGTNWGDLYIRVTHGDQGAEYWIDNVLLHFDAYVPPAPPAYLSVSYAVKTEQDRASISPYIYGNSVRFDIVDDALTMMRFGGNHTTPYNWETNYSNAGHDWYHSSGYANFPSGALPAGQEDVPGSVVTYHVDRALARNLESLVALPMAGYVAADKNGVVTEAETAPSARWKQTVYRKGAAFCNPAGSPNISDGYVYSDEFVNFLISRYGNASTATGVKFYALCNEPVLWSSSHPRIHPLKVTGAELIDRSTALASAVKDLDPYARIFGPVFYSHWPMYDLQNPTDWSTIQGEYSWFVDFYLDQMKQASNLYGARLMDVFTFHHYSHTNDTDTSEEHIRGRMQAPRFLWDPSYNSNPLLPRIQNSINTYNPGTGIAVTEWAFGGYNHVSGGIATADVLGIWGKYGLFAASYWTLKTESLYPNAAYRLYRNYDGSRSTFGDTKISASLSNRIDSSLYASTFAADPAKVSMIVLNKNMTIPIAGTFTIDSPRQFTSGRVWAFDAGGYTITERTPISSIAGNTFTYEIPPLTACHIVLTAVTAPVLPAIYEAENAVLSGPAIASANGGYSGTGYADYTNLSNDYIEWTVNLAASGSYAIDFQHANGSTGDRPLEIRVNGQVVAASLSFGPTGSWSTWQKTSSLTVSMQQGANTIRATAIGSSGTNVDYLEVDNAAANSAPVWNTNPVNETSATQGVSYSATLADNASDPDGNPLTFAKVSGPAWLTVASNGALSGTPGASDTGANAWTVSVSDGIAPAVQATLNITVMAETTPPSAPTGLVATAGSATVALDWANNTEPDLASYRVKRATVSGGPYTTIATGLTVSAYTDNSVTNGTTYYYVVSALDTNSNESANSSQVSAVPQSAGAPTFVAAGSIASSTGRVTPALPSGIASGDILLLFVETANQAVSIYNANGGTWAAVTNSPQGTGTAGGTSATRLTVFWSRYNGTQGAPTVSDSGNHQIARMIAIRGAAASGNPWDITAGGVESASDTSGSIPGATTTVNNTLVVLAVAGSLPDANGTSNFSAWSNASLTNLTERVDNTRSAGNGGALGIATGEKAVAGAYGTTAVTHASSAAKAMISIAIKK
jgi:hypothetical protein